MGGTERKSGGRDQNPMEKLSEPGNQKKCGRKAWTLDHRGKCEKLKKQKEAVVGVDDCLQLPCFEGHSNRLEVEWSKKCEGN